MLIKPRKQGARWNDASSIVGKVMMNKGSFHVFGKIARTKIEQAIEEMGVLPLFEFRPDFIKCLKTGSKITFEE